MKSSPQKDSSGLMKSIFAANLILILHGVLIVCVMFMVLFFRGIVLYLPWIMIVSSVVIFIIGYLLRRKVIQEGRQLKDMLSLPAFSGRTIEVSILGGFASIRLESPNPDNQLQLPDQNSGRLLASDSHQLRELADLVDLLNKNLITLEEYNKFKSKLLKAEGV